MEKNLFPQPLRDGAGRPPHHGHHPRDHPLHKTQDSAEYEEVMNKGHLRKIHASRIGKRKTESDCRNHCFTQYRTRQLFLHITLLAS